MEQRRIKMKRTKYSSSYYRQQIEFQNHINNSCKKYFQKIAALSKLTSYLQDSEEKKYLQLDNEMPIYLLSSGYGFSAREHQTT